MMPAGSQMQPGCGSRVLLAEDNEFNRELAGAVLAEQGYRVTMAEDGERAVALFREQAFDVVLMDVGMPRMDGYAATRAIRGIEAERGGHVPIIALTAHADPEERNACLDSGMDDLLAKPISGTSLAEGLARFGREAGGRDLFGEPAPHGAGAAPADRSVAPSQLDSLLSDRILADFSADPERLRTFFELLCTDLQTQINAMIAACDAADRTALGDAAHGAKGVARGLRDPALCRLAGEIERDAPAGNLSGIRAKLSRCTALCPQVKNC